MPFALYCLMAAIHRLGGHGRVGDIIELSGTEDPSGTTGHLLAAAKRLDWIERRSGFLWLTERGKIALAIVEGMQTRARAQGRQPKWRPYRQFKETHSAARREQERRASRECEAARWDGDAERGDAWRREDGAPAE